MSSNSTVVVTGASGLLGRAVMARLKESGAWKKVVGTAFSRSGLEMKHFKTRGEPFLETCGGAWFKSKFFMPNYLVLHQSGCISKHN